MKVKESLGKRMRWKLRVLKLLRWLGRVGRRLILGGMGGSRNRWIHELETDDAQDLGAASKTAFYGDS